MIAFGPHRTRAVAAVTAVLLAAVVSLAACTSDLHAGKRVHILDACVYDQFLETMDSKGIVQRCDCAAGKAMAMIDTKEIATYRIGHAPTGDLETKIRAALARCS